MLLNIHRAVTAWATSTCGPLAMVARRTIATVMDMQLQCGQYPLTAPSTTVRMHTTTKAAAQLWQARSATVPRIQTLAWPPLICTASAQQHTRAHRPQHRKPLEYLHWHWKQSKFSCRWAVSRSLAQCYQLCESSMTRAYPYDITTTSRGDGKWQGR